MVLAFQGFPGALILRGFFSLFLLGVKYQTTEKGGASPAPVGPVVTSPPEILGFGSLSWGEISEGGPTNMGGFFLERIFREDFFSCCLTMMICDGEFLEPFKPKAF